MQEYDEFRPVSNTLGGTIEKISKIEAAKLACRIGWQYPAKEYKFYAGKKWDIKK